MGYNISKLKLIVNYFLSFKKKKQRKVSITVKRNVSEIPRHLINIQKSSRPLVQIGRFVACKIDHPLDIKKSPHEAGKLDRS